MRSMRYIVRLLATNLSLPTSRTISSMCINLAQFSLQQLINSFASPLFVTWNTRSSRSGRAPRLRGCIGSFEALPLREGLAEYALISAFRDSRFRKIEERELESLECGYVTICPVFGSFYKTIGMLPQHLLAHGFRRRVFVSGLDDRGSWNIHNLLKPIFTTNIDQLVWCTIASFLIGKFATDHL